MKLDDSDSISSSLDSGSIVDDDSITVTIEDERLNHEQQDKLIRDELSKRESEAVCCLRLVLFFVLFLACVTVCVIVYLITMNAHDTEAEMEYQASARKVQEAFLDIAGSRLGALASVGVAATSHGVDHGQAWPFVTLSSFQQRGSTARTESGFLDIKLSPSVEESQRSKWEQFVREEHGWV